MHASAQWAPALFMRHTIAASATCYFFSLRWNHSFLFLNSKGIFSAAVGLTVFHFSGQKQGSWRLDAQTWEWQPSAAHREDSHPAEREKGKGRKDFGIKLQQKKKTKTKKKNLPTGKCFSGCLLNTGDTLLLKKLTIKDISDLFVAQCNRNSI